MVKACSGNIACKYKLIVWARITSGSVDCVLFINAWQVQVTPTTPPTGCGIPSVPVPNRNFSNAALRSH